MGGNIANIRDRPTLNVLRDFEDRLRLLEGHLRGLRALEESKVDWAAASAGTIHTDNYIEGGPGTDTTAFHANSDVDHDATTNFVAAEHIDWSVTGAEDVNVDRIAAGAVTQHESAIDHDQLLGFVAAEHIDWSVTGAEVIHADRYTAGATTHTIGTSAPGSPVLGELWSDTTGGNVSLLMYDGTNWLYIKGNV